jgi:hypothetical protein
MRPIKYEVWDKLNRRMANSISKICWFLNWEIASISYEVSEIETVTLYKWDFELRQFTWLLDNNLVEVYFDDLVKAPSWEIFQVIWYDEEMRIALKRKDTIYNFNVPLYEVVGNVYELLTK